MKRGGGVLRPRIFHSLRPRSARLRSTGFRFAVGALAAVFILVTMGAGDQSARFYKDSHSLMCVCGCNELLGECNHVGCEDSGRMSAELVSMISQGRNDRDIFHAFQQKYGPVVLAAPMFTPFNHLAWIIPPLVLLLAILLTLVIVRKWRLRTVPMPHLSEDPEMQAIRHRIRGETQL